MSRNNSTTKGIPGRRVELAKRTAIPLLLGILLILGATIRIYGAWSFRYDTHPDQGIVSLMAKHMAEGKDFPVFFYGQAYMGSLEPALSAIFCRLFGSSGFMVCMGTAFWGILLFPVIYLWGKDAGGRTAGFAALIYCLIGPSYYFSFLAAPRGGYALTLLLGTTILWFGGRILLRELDGPPPRRTHYFLLGLLAGFGWWTNQLIAANLLAAGLLFLVLLRKRLFTWRAIYALAAFLLGSLPFWIWNFRHDWRTFGFVQSFGRTPFLRGVRIFFSPCLARFLDLTDMPRLLNVAAVAIYLIAAGAALIILIAGVRGRKWNSATISLLTIFIFLIVYLLVFSRSHFAGMREPRYLLTVLPSLAVLLGTATARLQRHVRYGLAWIPLALLVAWQFPVFQGSEMRLAADREVFQDVQKLGDLLRRERIQAVYHRRHGLNFALKEEFTFCALQERYRPYREAAELADRIGIHTDLAHIESLAESIGVSARHEHNILFDFKAAEGGWTEIPPALWTANSETELKKLRMLSDRDLGTGLSIEPTQPHTETVEIHFANPVVLSGARLTGNCFKQLSSWQVQGRPKSEDPWTALTPVMPISGFYWSGTRFYWFGKRWRFHARFAPATVTQVRFHFPPDENPRKFSISEVQLFQQASDSGSEEESFPTLCRILEERQIDHLYSDRWVANKVFQQFGGKIRVELEPYYFPEFQKNPKDFIVLEPKTAILARSEDGLMCRNALSRWKIDMRETPVGPWVLFDFEPSQWLPDYAQESCLQWLGFACCLNSSRKEAALALVRRSDAIHAREGTSAGVIALLEEAARSYPTCEPAVAKLAERYREAGRIEDAENALSRFAALCKPEVPAAVDFQQDVRFSGISVAPRNVGPGESVTIKYYWQCRPESDLSGLAVFVHVEGKEQMFQDDHILLDGVNTTYQPFSETFIEERRVTIPNQIPPGKYDILIGLYQRHSGKRLRAKTDLPTSDRAVTLPVTLEIVR